MALGGEPASCDRRALGRVGGRRRFLAASALGRRARIVAVATLAVAALCFVAAAGASAFSAHGSVEQVYVTGLAPCAQMSLLGTERRNASPRRTPTRTGGLLFRKVTPGKGYRVKLVSTSEESGPITVYDAEAGAVGPQALYKQPIAESGYGYLTTRDGTQLAIDVHPPGIPSGLAGSPPSGLRTAEEKSRGIRR